jgi:hypothetical protein
MTYCLYMMKSIFSVSTMVFVMLSASLAGCFGDDDSSMEEYTGPIDLVVYYDATSGQIEQSWNGNTPTQNEGVTLTFDFASTSSSAGDITTLFVDPDDGSDRVEQAASDSGDVSYTWMTHGLFFVDLGAIDSDGNEHSIMINVRIDMHITRAESPSSSHTMTFDATSGCTDGDPLPNRIEISSTASNQQGNVFNPGQNSDVNWSLTDGEEDLVDSSLTTVNDGADKTWDTSTMAIVAGDWTLSLTVTQGDPVSLNNEVTITYVEGSESGINPRPV